MMEATELICAILLKKEIEDKISNIEWPRGKYIASERVSAIKKKAEREFKSYNKKLEKLQCVIDEYIENKL